MGLSDAEVETYGQINYGNSVTQLFYVRISS